MPDAEHEPVHDERRELGRAWQLHDPERWSQEQGQRAALNRDGVTEEEDAYPGVHDVCRVAGGGRHVPTEEGGRPRGHVLYMSERRPIPVAPDAHDIPPRGVRAAAGAAPPPGGPRGHGPDPQEPHWCLVAGFWTAAVLLALATATEVAVGADLWLVLATAFGSCVCSTVVRVAHG